ncbi:hypothetical protein BGZ81_000760 [Podila clonocystis]|nr:hypothetical protein BGZ81_000760 [Podila clonocystis]
MHKLFKHAGGRHTPSAEHNKPLPEPVVDPDEGKTPIGELVIIPIQGRDLPNRERFGKQDPFILFKLGNVSKRSSTDVRGGQRPRWNDEQINILMYQSDAKDATSLYVSCMDEDHQKNDLIGDCVINLAKVLERGEHDDWFELKYRGREAGELMIQLTYYSRDPQNPTNRLNRPGSELPTRRPIHPTNAKPAKVEPQHATSDPKPTVTSTEDGAVYKPPVVAALYRLQAALSRQQVVLSRQLVTMSATTPLILHPTTHMLNNTRNSPTPTVDTQPTLQLQHKELTPIPTSGFLDKDTHPPATHPIKVIHHNKVDIHPRSTEATHLSIMEDTRHRTREDTRHRTREDIHLRTKEDTHHRTKEDTRHRAKEDTRHRIKDIHHKTTDTHPRIAEDTHLKEVHLPDTHLRRRTCTLLLATLGADTHSNSSSNHARRKTQAQHSPLCQAPIQSPTHTGIVEVN